MKLFKKGILVIGAMMGLQQLSAQTAEEVVARYSDSAGGKAAWSKITSIKMEGTLSVNGTDVNITRTVLQGKGMRVDISVMGMTGYQIMTPTEGWKYMPFQGQSQKEAVTADEVKESQEELETSSGLIFYKERGHTIELAGKEDVDGTECFNIKLTEKSGKVINYLIDTKMYSLIKKKEKIKANGQEVELMSSYSNYQKLPEGVSIAMSITQEFGELVLNKVELNKPVDEKIFKPE